MNVDIALLKKQHSDIIDAGTMVISLLEKSPEVAMPQLGKARSVVAYLIADHFKSEETELYARLRANDLTDLIPGYSDIMLKIRELRTRYSVHIGEWPARRIQDNWTEYTAIARYFMSAVIDLIKQEEREIYPVAISLLAKIR